MPRRNHMHKSQFVILIALASLTCASSIAATPAATPAKPAAAAAKPAAPAKAPAPIKVQETAITYEEAEQHVGDRIIVHTVNKTTRTGTLTDRKSVV